VWAEGIRKFTVFGERALTADWTAFLRAAQDIPLDMSRKKEPVHEGLANMTLDVDSLYVFTKTWGLIAGDTDPLTGRFLTRPRDVQPFQHLLQKAWSGETYAISKMAKDESVPVQWRYVTVPVVAVSKRHIDIAVVDLWNLVRLLFMRDYAAGRTKVCANPDCPSPYFLQRRRGQKYCSHKCAVLANVRRFREKEAKAKSSPKRRARQ